MAGVKSSAPSGRTTYRGPAGTGSRATGQANAPGFASGLGALADMLSGAGIGATAATLGVGGDLEKLARGLYGAATARPEQDRLAAGLLAAERSTLPSTEDVRGWLPNPTQFSMAVDQNPYSQLGEFLPLPANPAAVAQGAKALGGATLRAAKPAVGGLGRLAAAGVARGVEDGRGPLAFLQPALQPSYAVRPRGGNFDAEGLHNYLGNALNVHTPQYLEHAWVPEGANARTGPAAEWAQKQLANYLKRDLGAPTDPLLQLEKELPGLHFADGIVPESMRSEDLLRMQLMRETVTPQYRQAEAGQGLPQNQRALEALKVHDSLTGGQGAQPLTPWGAFSDTQLVGFTPREYASELAGDWDGMGIEDEFEALRELRDDVDFSWLEKLPEDANIWSMYEPNQDNLGFGHVLDYFEAANPARQYGVDAQPIWDALKKGLSWNEAAATDVGMMMSEQDYNRWKALHDAGLTLTPEQIAKTSVPDAVRKTAEWNKLLAAGMGGPKNPDLMRGWKNVMKEYPDDGMKWVELGSPAYETLPAGHKLSTTQMPDGSVGHYVEGSNSTGEVFSSPEAAMQEFRSRVGAQDLQAALRAEGDTMGICVGSNPEYCERALAGTGRIFSLRDKNGNPHVTVETRPGRDWSERGGFMADKPQLEEAWGRFVQTQREMDPDTYIPDRFAPSKFPDWLKQDSPDIYEAYAGQFEPAPEDIIQIKGKQNAAPLEKYLPYVQDFVKSGKWGRVGDLQNTGLRYIGDSSHGVYDLRYGGTGNEIRFPDAPQAWRPPTGYYTQEDLHKLMQEHLPADEAQQYMELLGWARKREYAAGGSVQPGSTFLQRAQAMLAQGYAGGGAVQRLSKLWHAGTIKPGDELTRPLFTAESPELAATYLDMAADRGMTGAQLLPYSFDLRRAAPEREVATFAKQAGIDFEDGTPASAFDQEIHGAEPVGRLLRLLRQRGYDHTVLDDIGYGAQIEGKAHVIFPEPGRRANRAAP